MVKSSSIEDVPLIDALAEVFSRYGYEGASLNRLSDASNLKRSSLYHRFPGGKDEIVQAVISRAEDRYASVLGPAFEDGDPEERAERVALGLADYYGNGEASCVIIALSLSDDEGRAQGGQCVLGWADGFARIASDSGMSDADALEAALDAIAVIEGALVIAATTGRKGPFERALSGLPASLTTTR
ncbi:MAG: TetR/AcrR family transcriptional regulator [Acidimicrobiales bacterium]